MRQHIKAYIESNGTVLPTDLLDYREGAAYGHLCFLCGNQHFNAHWCQEMDPTTELMVDAHMCANCAFDVEQGIQRKDAGLPYDSFIKDSSSRLYQFIRAGGAFIWPPDEYVRSPMTCYTCHGVIDFNHYMEMEIPVGEGDKRNGGIVNVCGACAEALENEQPEDAYPKDTCYKCKRLYPITEVEAEYRDARETNGSHLCHRCFTHTHGFAERWETHACSKCQNSLVVDLSQYLVKDIGTVVCNSCKETYSGKGRDSTDIYVTLDPGFELILHFITLHQVWSYSLYYLLGDSTSSKLLITESTKTWPNIEEASFQGHERYNDLRSRGLLDAIIKQKQRKFNF